MTRLATQLQSVTFAILLVTSLFAFAGVGGAAPGDPSTYAVKQGSQCWEVTPLGDGTQSVGDFYDYRHPDTEPPANDYASYGTEHLQENQVSQLFLYNGSQGVSLVMLHDQREVGPGGSTITFDISGLPADREWAVEDDNYGPDTDDNFSHGATESTIDWVWAKHRTDGAAVRGLESSDYTAVQIDPGFNEQANEWGFWPYSGDAGNRTDAWKLITSPDMTDPSEKTVLDMSQSLTIEQGGCPSAPSADLSGPDNVEVNTSFTFDASGSSDEGNIVSYEWDFDGDGNVDDTTTGATTTHSYQSNGTYDATVTVTDDDGETAMATKTVTVTDPDDQPPSASLSVNPTEAEVNVTEVTLDASGSTDNGQIANYHWDFDGDGTVDSSTDADTTTHTYAATGEFDATVTVEDASGNSDTANATVTVSDTTQPTANADVPDTVVNGSSFQVDGSASTDNGGITSYEWDFGDNTTKNGATASHSYADNGTYTITLTVTDGAGNSNSTSAQVTVNDEDTQSPSAALTAPDNTEVGNDVTFDASGSNDDGEIVEYRWDFNGDGNVQRITSSSTVTHSYSSTGNYQASVTVADSADNTDTATKTVSVTDESNEEPPTDGKPTADFTWSFDSKNDSTVHFDASNSTDDGEIADSEYDWDVLGNGKWHRSGETIVKTYRKYGTYNVTLRVIDADDNVDTVTKTVHVKDRTKPTGDIDAPGEVKVGQTFTAKAVNVGDNVGVTHVCWEIDGKQVDGDNKHNLTTSFDSTGKHTLKLHVKDANGNEHTTTHTVNVAKVSNGGGGGGGGGGGNQAGGSNDDSDEMDWKVDNPSDDVVDVGVENGKTNEAFTVDLPGSSEAGDQLATYGAITVELTHDGDYDLSIKAVEDPPESVTEPTVDDQGFEALSYLLVDSPEDVNAFGETSFTFTVEKSRLEALDASAEDINIYRYDDGSWSSIETTVVDETDETVEYRANSSALSTFAVSVDRPVMGLENLAVSQQEIAPGQTVEITATLTNDGNADGEMAVEIGLDGDTLETRDVSLASGDEQTITFERTLDEPGTHILSVNGQEVEVVVQAETTDDSDTTSTTAPTTEGPGQSGFGAVLALVALLGAALFALRRQ